MWYLDYAAVTETGRRETNQDACIATLIEPDVYFLAVADGMGGHAGGEIASTMLIDEAEAYLRRLPHTAFNEDLRATVSNLYDHLMAQIRSYKDKQPQYADMGSTLVLALIHEGKMVVGNVGDSRLYLRRGKSLTQITTDHSYVAEYLKSATGPLDTRVLRQYAHVVTRAMEGNEVEADVFPVQHEECIRLRHGAVVLLCSDGLILDKMQQVDYLGKALTPRVAAVRTARRLVDKAIAGGSTDNVTAVVARYFGGKRAHHHERYIGF